MNIYIVIIRALSASSIGLLLEISSPTYLNILLYYQVHSIRHTIRLFFFDDDDHNIDDHDHKNLTIIKI